MQVAPWDCQPTCANFCVLDQWQYLPGQLQHISFEDACALTTVLNASWADEAQAVACLREACDMCHYCTQPGYYPGCSVPPTADNEIYDLREHLANVARAHDGMWWIG